jgi:hypothetical protein
MVHPGIYNGYSDGKITQGQSPFTGSQRLQWGHDRHLQPLAPTTHWSRSSDNQIPFVSAAFPPSQEADLHASESGEGPLLDLCQGRPQCVGTYAAQARTHLSGVGVRLGQTSRAKVRRGAGAGVPPTTGRLAACQRAHIPITGQLR